MCEYCHYARGHNPQCPEAEQRKVICWCIECKEGVYEGDIYYKIGTKLYCRECVEVGREVAEAGDLYDDWDWDDQN